MTAALHAVGSYATQLASRSNPVGTSPKSRIFTLRFGYICRLHFNLIVAGISFHLAGLPSGEHFSVCLVIQMEGVMAFKRFGEITVAPGVPDRMQRD